jgi:hypothetical protein
MAYDELNYSLTAVTAEVATQKAIHILEAIALANPACLFYCMQASNIVALAGLRAQSPYNSFHPDFSAAQQQLLAGILHEHGCEILYDKDPYSEGTANSFSLLNFKAFDELPERYGVLKSFWKPPHKLQDLVALIRWSNYIQSELVRQMEQRNLPTEWLLDRWAPHTVRFGMLLGYPGQAISSVCWAGALEAKNEPTGHLIGPSIPFQGIYSGAHVGYDYDESLKHEPVIVQHEALWSDALHGVYEVFTEERLMALPEFKQEYERYQAYDENA